MTDDDLQEQLFEWLLEGAWFSLRNFMELLKDSYVNKYQVEKVLDRMVAMDLIRTKNQMYHSNSPRDIVKGKIQ